MGIRTLGELWRRRQLRLLLKATQLVTPYCRATWRAAASRAGLLRRLAEGPQPLERLARELAPKADDPEGLRAWLDTGVSLRELECRRGEYALRGSILGPAPDRAADWCFE